MTAATDLLTSYPHRLAGHCGSGSLRDLLELHGLDYGRGPLSEGACFGLAGGLGFLFIELPGFVPPFYVVGRTGSMEEDVAVHLGLGLSIEETDDPDAAWSLVKREVDSGRPPMLWADIAQLEYLRVKMSNTRHDIVVVAYDEDEGVAWIADNDRDALQRCSLESLARARASNGFPGPNRHRTYRYEWPAQLRAADEAIGAALGTAVANMLGEDEALGGMDVPTGLPAVHAFAASYPTWSETLGEGMDTALGALRVLIVKAGTGGALFRSLHAEFLHDAAVLLDDAPLGQLAAHYDELASTWATLAEHAGTREHKAGIAHVERIARLEAEGVEAMAQWLR
jgi:hypothetical protein